MSSKNLHIINKVYAELTVADADQHREKSQRLNEVIQKAIEQLGSKMDIIAGDSIILIDQLPVEIGIKESGISELEDVLAGTLSDKLDELLQDRKNGSNKAGSNSNVTEISNEQNQKEILAYFLLTGRLPWKAAPYDLRDAERWLKNLSLKEWLEFIKPLSGKNAGTASRLASQFPDSVTENIIKQTSIAHYRNDEISPFIHDLLRYANSKNTNENEFRQIKSELYRRSLGGLLSGAGKEKIFRSLLASVIRAIGSKKSFQTIYTELMKRQQKMGSAKRIRPNVFEKLSWDDISEDESNKSLKRTSSLKSDYDGLADETESITIINAGVVLLHPFLTSLFKNLNYTDDGEFVSQSARERAVCLVHYLATGSTEFPEHQLLLAKLLCGWPLAETVDRFLHLSDKETNECDTLLANAVQHWGALKNTSPEGLQKNFLQREGILKKGSFGWTLYIENRTHDILLDKLPWGLSIIKLKWMHDMLTVDWK